jgi:hypothetical protein
MILDDAARYEEARTARLTTAGTIKGFSTFGAVRSGLTRLAAPPKIKYARYVFSKFKRDSFAAQRKAAGLLRL